MSRRGWLLAGLLLGLPAGLLATLLYLLAGSLPGLDGERRLPGLSAPATIERDARGALSIEAGTRRDAFRAQGYADAQTRYFEMDLMRRAAAGELAALLGPAALERDRSIRPHRFRARAREFEAGLPPDQRGLLQAYVEGVNAGLQALRVRPWPYLLLRQRPAPWRPEDSLLVALAMSIDLQWRGHERELHLARIEALNPALAEALAQPGSPWDAALLPPEDWPAPALPGPEALDLRPLRGPPAAATIGPAAFDDADWASGSNSWAVAGKLSRHGGALLANDMHLGLRVPALWQHLRLRHPDRSRGGQVIQVVGVALPGLPGIIAGSNGDIAWGWTNSYGDWMDWVRVELDPEDLDRYRVPEGWARFERHRERIAVADGSSVEIEIRETRWGPVLAEDASGPLALAWTAHHREAIDLHLLELARARDVEQALQIGQSAGMPQQNLIVADRHGRIGWTLAGPIPRRNGIDPARPSTWLEPGQGWVGWLLPAEYPRLIDPAEGRLWTANSRVVGGPALARVGDGGYALGTRATAIRDGLRSIGAADEAAMLALQLDTRSALLLDWAKRLAELPGTPPELAALLDGFDGRAEPDSVSYRLVREFRHRVSRALIEALHLPLKAVDPDLPVRLWPQHEALVWALLEARPEHLLPPDWADWDAGLIGIRDALLAEWEAQRGGLGARTWGEHNRAAIRHPLSAALPLLGRLMDMPAEPLPGDTLVVRVQAPAFGASQRLVVSPGREADGILQLPGGPLAHPLSGFAGAGHREWVSGEPVPLLPGRPRHRLTLLP